MEKNQGYSPWRAFRAPAHARPAKMNPNLPALVVREPVQAKELGDRESACSCVAQSSGLGEPLTSVDVMQATKPLFP